MPLLYSTEINSLYFIDKLVISFQEFRNRNVKLCGVSCENVQMLFDWRCDITTFYGLKEFDICLVGDEDRQVARR